MNIFKKRVYQKTISMPLYIFLIISMLVLSWEAHFFYPQYAEAAPQATNHLDGSSQDHIPEDSIRLRIKSNSNSAMDQQLKINIRDEVNKNITQWTGSLLDLDIAREVIDERIPELEEVIADELDKLGSDSTFNVSLQEGVSFPTKRYGSRVYPGGEYEAVFIEIGDGDGDNWWCVLFPPLCFLEVSGEVDLENNNQDATNVSGQDYTGTDEEDEENVEISFFVVEVLQSLWAKMN